MQTIPSVLSWREYTDDRIWVVINLNDMDQTVDVDLKKEGYDDVLEDLFTGDELNISNGTCGLELAPYQYAWYAPKIWICLL